MAQRFTNWECIVIDNSSTDKTVEIVESFIASHKNFTIYRKPNDGPASARNFGYLKISSGSHFVHWLDGDDLLHPDFLEKCVLHLTSNPHVGIVGVQFSAIDAAGRELGPRRRSRWKSGFILPQQIPEGVMETPFEVFFYATGQGPFSVFRKSDFEKTQRWTEAFWTHEDSDIFCQMALISKVHYLPDELYIKREHLNSITASRKQSNYGDFRLKWDNYSTGDLDSDAQIAKAIWWYYHRHRPLRDLKIAFKTLQVVKFRLFRTQGQWARVCIVNAFWGIILGNHRRANNWR